LEAGRVIVIIEVTPPSTWINLPDTDLSIPALTDKDVADLEFVVRFADIVGLSFVRAPEDVFSLQDHLTRLGAEHLGVVLRSKSAVRSRISLNYC
jgi:pyruvate kinase